MIGPRRGRAATGALTALLLAAWAAATGAVESIGVGPTQRVRSWVDGHETSRYVVVRADSIWMPGVQADGNLAPGLVEREGATYVAALLPRLERQDAAMAMFDGNATTAFDPDESDAVERTDTLVVDLGASYRINRIRLHPRLDLAHRNRFLQEFKLLYLADGVNTDVLGAGRAVPRCDFTWVANTEPVVDRRFTSITARYLAVVPLANREWEIAELEVYGDGTVPVGELVSVPLGAGRQSPAWGRVLLDGDDLGDAPFTVQTRTGTTREPLLYTALNGDLLVPVNRVTWMGLADELKGPVTPSPDWSDWVTVTDGLVRSPPLQRYLQFRLRMPRGGVSIHDLSFEYSYPPIARSLTAEVNPSEALAGEQISFSIALVARLHRRGNPLLQDTGFHSVEIGTDAQIEEVTGVFVDDRATYAATSYQPGEGFTVNLGRPIVQDGSYLEIHFTGRVFRDRTRFEVQALDRRRTAAGTEVAYQVAREGDADELSPGTGLVVQLSEPPQGVPVLGDVQAASRVVTPNGDGLNDSFTLRFSLFKLVDSAPVALEIRRLDGRSVARLDFTLPHGTQAVEWDGLESGGAPVAPGLYLYELRVEADDATYRHVGSLGVAY